LGVAPLVLTFSVMPEVGLEEVAAMKMTSSTA
jgi:hypothetical protein